MSVRVEITRNGETVTDSSLTQTIDSEFDLHYGGAVPELHSGDSVTIHIDSPPQVARHQGYETAFLRMDSLELQVS